MRYKVLILIISLPIFLHICLLSVDAQKKKTQKRMPVTVIIEELPDLNAQIEDFAFVVEIDRNANVSLKIQKTENDEFIANDSSTSDLTEFFKSFTDLQNLSKDRKNTIAPIIVVKADNRLEFGKIRKIIESLRVSPKQKLKLQISEDAYVGILPLKTKGNFAKPNPLFLLVEMQNDGKIKLNYESQGALQNFAPLKMRLSEVFRSREDNGVFREGLNEVEKTVYVKVSDSIKFSDVIKLVQAVAETGANPIGIQLGEENLPDEPARPE